MAYVWKEQKIPAGREFTGEDHFYDGMRVLFRATSASVRVSLIDGGHTGSYPAAFDFFDRQRRGKPVDWTVGAPKAKGATSIPN